MYNSSIATQIFDSKIGGFGGILSSLVYSADIEEVEVILTLQTSGNVRVTVNDGQNNLVGGIPLTVDCERKIRLNRGQRLYATTDDTFTQQTVSVVVQPLSQDERVLMLLDSLLNALRSFGWQQAQTVQQSLDRMAGNSTPTIRISAPEPEKCESLAGTVIKQGLRKLK